MADEGSNGGGGGGTNWDWSSLLNGILSAQGSTSKKGKTDWREIERLMALDTQMNRTDRQGLFSGWEWSEDPETGRWTQTQTVPNGMLGPKDRLFDRAAGMGMNPYTSPEQFGSMLDAKMANQMNQQGILSEQPDLRRLFGDYSNSRDGMFPSGAGRDYGIFPDEAQDGFFLDDPDSDGQGGGVRDNAWWSRREAELAARRASRDDGSSGRTGSGGGTGRGGGVGTGSTGGVSVGGNSGGNNADGENSDGNNAGGGAWNSIRDWFYDALPFGAAAVGGTAGWLAGNNPVTSWRAGDRAFGWGERLRNKNDDRNASWEGRGHDDFIGPPSPDVPVIEIRNGRPAGDQYNPTIHDAPNSNSWGQNSYGSGYNSNLDYSQYRGITGGSSSSSGGKIPASFYYDPEYIDE
jgi:hypothetical protein